MLTGVEVDQYGGPGRTRTCNQTVMSGQPFAADRELENGVGSITFDRRLSAVGHISEVCGQADDVGSSG
jgi:hypothetical protein